MNRRSRIRRLEGARVKGLMGGAAERAIYGVSWDKGSSPTLTRTDGAVGWTEANFSTAEIYRSMTSVTDDLGNEFIRIPKFYIRQADGVGSKTWQISRFKHSTEWYLPGCFYNYTTASELPYVDVGKHQASLDGSNRLESKPDRFPLVSKNIVEFRGYARANGSGYGQLDLVTYHVLQVLLIVRYGTLNMQSIAQGFTGGRYNASDVATVAESAVNRIIVANATAALYLVGQTIGIGTSLGGNQVASNRVITSIDVYDASNKAISFDGAAVNVAIGNILYNMAYKTGSAADNANNKKPSLLLGLYDIYGGCWQWVDGVNISDRQIWVCADQTQYASNLFASPYVRVGYDALATEGYATAMGYDAALPWAVLPSAVGGGSTTYYADYYYPPSAATQRVALVGGFWSFSSGAGPSCWSLYNGSTSGGATIGGRLIRKVG